MVPIQYIIHDNQLPILEHAQAALTAGCKWIQFRPYNVDNKQIVSIAQQIKELCKASDATFMIENDIELTKAIDADGVHLTEGQEVFKVRQALGEGFLIGTNAANAESVIQHKKQSADYICCGPFGSDDNQLSLLHLKTITRKVESEGIFLPLSTYGTFTIADIPLILATGIRGITLEINEEHLSFEKVKMTLQAYLNA